MELFKINCCDQRQSVSDSLSMSMADTSKGPQNLSLNEKIAMCSSMIGYCHYLEAASGAIGFPEGDISDINNVRTRIE